MVSLSLVLAMSYNGAAAQDFVPGEVVVEFIADKPMALRRGLPAAGVRSVGRRSAVVRSSRARSLHQTSSLNESVQSCIDLFKSGEISSCSPNYIVRSTATVNDPLIGSLWGMTGPAGINAPAAWDLSTGSSEIVVAVIDTGIDYSHPDLAGNLWRNAGEVPGNGIDDDANGYVDDYHGINAVTGTGNPMDDNGHGTHVAGTIGAVGNNAVGVVGVNQQLQLMGLKFLQGNGSGTLSDAIEAIDYMVMMKGRGVNIRVSNNSWGGGGFSAPLESAIKRARDAGILFAAAAGNEANDNDATQSYPASYEIDSIVSVAAIDAQGNLASFSNYGASHVDIAAPGVQILSTYPGNRYAQLSGTSMATPHVAGALALLLGREPTLSPVQALARIYESGVTLPTLSGVVRTGRTLNVSRALRGETAPIEAPAAPVSCSYSVTEIGFNPDLRVDAAPVVMQADEFNFYTLALPFQFPFKGRTINSLTLSPNGVIYANGAPSAMDYLNKSSAPLASIAALHTDLRSDATGLGIRVLADLNSVTIKYTAKQYWQYSGPGKIEVWVSIYPSGAIEQQLRFSDSTVENYVRGRATIGITGYSSADSETFAFNSTKIRSGLGVSYAPLCGDASPVTGAPSHVSSLKVKRNNKVVRTVNNGGRFDLTVQGVGNGALTLTAAVNGVQCGIPVQTSLTGNIRKLAARAPRNSNVGKISFVVTHEGGSIAKSGTISVRRDGKQQKTRRLAARSRNSVCQGIMNSLRPQ
jgi:subtilisin family serine protease